jgi:hypothetical protein
MKKTFVAVLFMYSTTGNSSRSVPNYSADIRRSSEPTSSYSAADRYRQGRYVSGSGKLSMSQRTLRISFEDKGRLRCFSSWTG